MARLGNRRGNPVVHAWRRSCNIGQCADASPQRGSHCHAAASMTGEVMRIAMLAPISWRTPPRHYGPCELVTSLLTEAPVARGLGVTLFAKPDSETPGQPGGICPRPSSVAPPQHT